MTPTQKAAMTAALEALEYYATDETPEGWHSIAAITALRAALAETAEPVAWIVELERGGEVLEWNADVRDGLVAGTPTQPLYTAPQPPAPVGDTLVENKPKTAQNPAQTRMNTGFDRGGEVAAPAVELTDAELGIAIDNAIEGGDLYEVCRAAIAAHEAKRGKA